MPRLPMLFSVLALAAAPAVGAAADREIAVRFKPGTTSAAYRDTIKGYDAVSYYLEARAGQRLFVDFGKNENGCYFNILSPAEGRTLVNGSAIDPAGLLLEETGEYRVVVYLMRATARRGARCTFSINFLISD